MYQKTESGMRISSRRRRSIVFIGRQKRIELPK